MNKKWRVVCLLALMAACIAICACFYETPVVKYIGVLLDISSLLILVVIAEITVVRFFGLLRPKRYPETDKIKKFAIVVSARNERNVIENLIDSIRAQKYPADACDIFVIADNCTDDTADVCRKRGAIVYERHDLEHIGKGFALGWFFDRFNKKYSGIYDAISIFDADNLLDPYFLAEMNKTLCTGARAAAGFRDTKNPYDNVISGGTALLFYDMARLYYSARNSVGLSALFVGTGYCFDPALIADGWRTTTITEDGEFSMKVIAKGVRIEYVRAAVYYDEQPTKLSVSLKQRYRWAVGNHDCVKVCTLPLFRGIFIKGRSFICFDAFCRSLFPFCTALRMVLAIAEKATSALAIYFGRGSASVSMTADFINLRTLIVTLIATYIFSFAFAVLILLLEKKPIRPMLPSLFFYPVHVIAGTVINIIALFYRDRQWHHIDHDRAIDISQIKATPLPATDEFIVRTEK